MLAETPARPVMDGDRPMCGTSDGLLTRTFVTAEEGLRGA